MFLNIALMELIITFAYHLVSEVNVSKLCNLVAEYYTSFLLLNVVER